MLLILEVVVVVLFLLWLLGAMLFPIGGSTIHLLIALALIILVVRLALGKRPPI